MPNIVIQNSSPDAQDIDVSVPEEGMVTVIRNTSRGLPMANILIQATAPFTLTNNGREFRPARYVFDEELEMMVLASPAIAADPPLMLDDSVIFPGHSLQLGPGLHQVEVFQ